MCRFKRQRFCERKAEPNSDNPHHTKDGWGIIFSYKALNHIENPRSPSKVLNDNRINEYGNDPSRYTVDEKNGHIFPVSGNECQEGND